jgi:hypothetical protein
MSKRVMRPTLRRGERVQVSLRDHAPGATNAFRGRVVGVDALSIRLDVTASRFHAWWVARSDRRVVIPWGNVAVIAVGRDA